MQKCCRNFSWWWHILRPWHCVPNVVKALANGGQPPVQHAFFLQPHSPKWSSQVMSPTMFHNGCSDVHMQLLASILIPSNNLIYLAANVWIINPSILLWWIFQLVIRYIRRYRSIFSHLSQFKLGRKHQPQ